MDEAKEWPLRDQSMENKLDRLKAMGFKVAGQWKQAEGRITCDLTDFATATNVLYGFVVDGEVKYVGKTVKALRIRMSGYRSPAPTQSTNIKNNAKIAESLLAGKVVDIYVLPDNGLLHYGGFHVNLAAGLEDSVVRELSPPWNGGQKEAGNETLEPVAEEPSSPD